VMRNDHQDALAAGLAVTEYARFGKSADEIRDLWQWTQAKLNGGENRAGEYPEIEFPIILGPTPAGPAIDPAPDRPLPTWAETGLAWDSGL
jgi:chromosome partitioning protein